MLNKMRIRTKLLLITVLAGIVPVAIVATIIGVFLSTSIVRIRSEVQGSQEKMSDEVIGTYVKSEADVTARRVDAYLSERIRDVSSWAVDPTIRQAAKEASARASDIDLIGLDENVVETRMQASRSLIDDPSIGLYLEELIQNNPAFSELFFTDEHGFTAAYSNKPSDFIQSGETWWDAAWTTGSFIGAVEYDESAKVYSSEIDVRIDDENGRPLGVIKAVMDIKAIQDHATEAAERLSQSSVHIFTGDGFLIADTISKNDPQIIMKDAGNVLQHKWKAAQQITSQDSRISGFLLGQNSMDDRTQVVLGYAHTAPGSFYELPGFKGFDWYITVEQPADVAMAPLAGLEIVANDLDESRHSMVLFIIVVSFVSLIASAILSIYAARSIVDPINKLAGIGQRFTAGDMDIDVKVEHTNEIGILEASFQQMLIKIRQLLQNERGEREYMDETVQTYLSFLQNVGSGKLKYRLDLNGGQRDQADPMLRLGREINQMAENLHSAITQVRDAANNLAAAAAEILAATTQQAAGASEQSAAISQTTVTVEEVKTIAEQSSMRAQEVASAAQRTIDVSRTGSRAVMDTIGSMQLIQTQVQAIAENILALSEQTQQVGEIISTVSDIASQSNMLALNASVEAARAGEQGRGFSVVAAEVRNLAEQSRQATTQIKTILTEIQKATNITVMAIEEGSKGVERGVGLASQAQESIQQLTGVIDVSAQTAVQVVAAGRQQVSGVDQVAVAIQNINQAMMQSLASTRQAEKAAQNLAELAHRLSDTVARYQV